ncbi:MULTISPECIES: tyrosine-type recombinase/integrase [unclassified Rhizobium]|uniref:tyrosine-type recombinase/integrase n=1 Tax=unclassified Rhizobium TaxID=2613769 RepID=UPI0007EB1F62|nr:MULTISPECIES: tyrosine-type recombinase/integrase [unclassified Rhizobium]ANK91555.1 integrase family protein [Rhizobium sp. N6212]ANK97588.1 integrase family protein [Rhizobium sp. N621]
MSVYKTKASPFYRYDFQIDGNRFHGTTKARDRREAKSIERTIKDNAKRDVEQVRKSGSAPLTMDTAVGRYWTEKGQYRSDPKPYFATLERLIGLFGKDTRLDEIDDETVVSAISKLRERPRWGKVELKKAVVKPVANGTINRQLVQPLKSIFRRARIVWRCSLPNEPIWNEHWLKEPQERVRELNSNEQIALVAFIRKDYLPWFEFLQISGRRFNETLLRWSDVNWEAGSINTKGKGGRDVWTPITPTIRRILVDCRGNHPEYVFTFVAERTRDGKVKGKRYPITYHGTMIHFRRALAASGVQNFRLHDNRHDTATKLLRVEKNLKLVQRVLNHANIATTTKYAHVMDDEVASALERHAESRNKPRTS